jgi:hypothetical protein
MSATATSAVLVAVQPVFSDAGRLALAGFLAGYRGQTREAYSLDLRQFTTWCRDRSLPLFTARRAGIGLFARDLGGSPRLPVRISGSRAGAGAPDPGHHPQGRQGRHHPAGAQDRPGDRPGRRGARRWAGVRAGGRADGRRLDRHSAARIVRRVAHRAGIAKKAGPHTLRHAFITAALDAGVPLRDVQEAASHADPRTTMRYDRARGSLDRHATYIVAAYLAGAAR